LGTTTHQSTIIAMECLLSVLHKDTFIPVRLLEDYSNEAHQSAIAVAIEFSKLFKKQSFSLIMKALKGRMTMGVL
jgi:hypothetical protein